MKFLSVSRKKIAAALVILIAMGASFGAGFETSSTISNENPSIVVKDADSTDTSAADMGVFWKTWSEINDLYVGTMPSDQDKIYAATEGLVASLNDPYSEFFPPKESQYFQSEIEGDFEGVGMEIEVKDDVLTVVSALKDTPAEEAGIKAGDQILDIDGKSTQNLALNDAVDEIRGAAGTKVTLTVSRAGVAKPFDVAIVRNTINPPVVDTQDFPDQKTFLIRIYSFSAPAADKFRDALRQFVNLSINNGYQHLIIDLRDNPGGYLDSAVDIASWFLPLGDVVVKEDFGGKQPDVVHRSEGYDIFNSNLKLAVLVNGGSASAAEILAGALEKNGVATLIGETTFGKGSVQQLVDLTPDTSLKVTVARWLLPDGSTISEKGITPDIVVPLTDDDAKAGKDPQLDAALKFLAK